MTGCLDARPDPRAARLRESLSLVQRRRAQAEAVGTQRVALLERGARAAQDAAEAELRAQLVDGVVETPVAVGAARVVRGRQRWIERELVRGREEPSLPAGRRGE